MKTTTKRPARGSTRAAKTGGAPSSTALFLTGLCPNECRFCFERSENATRYVREKSEVLAAIEELRAAGAGSVDLIGGEPLLHPDFAAIARAAAGAGLRVNVTTNGLALADRAFARKVLPLLDGVVVSIHAGDARAYRALTGNDSGFATLRQALRELRRAGSGVRVMFNTTLTHRSLGTLEGILALVAPFAGARWDITNPFPLGGARDDYAAIAPRIGEASRAFAGLVPRARAAGVVVRFSFFPACAFGYATEHSNDVAEPALATGYRVDHALNPEHPGDLVFRRAFGRPCRACRLRRERLCFGVPEAYLAAFGDADLRPPGKEPP
ncbi:MAG: radical SAM protein [Deltaproteobacteria bacterium]|nr:radical SAM protein [Deltaproteobacteria bacterium]